MMVVAAVLDLWRRYHEVSILIAAGLERGAVLRLTATLEGLDDDHAATAAGIAAMLLGAIVGAVVGSVTEAKWDQVSSKEAKS